MLLKIEDVLHYAPYILKEGPLHGHDSAPPDATPSPCQICFDDFGRSTQSAVITSFCSTTCPAVVCRTCLAEHIRLSIAAAFPGVLPKVRCPICLVQVNKAAWEHLVSTDVVEKYKEACRIACSFRTPCCHDLLYTHLPRELNATDLPSRYIKPVELTLEASLESQLDVLHAQTRRFSNFEISAKELMNFVEDTFGRYVDINQQHLILEHELPTILDEERRATLLLAYHAKYKVVKTRCCGAETCFNCKRSISRNKKCNCDGAPLIPVHGVLECRSCHVTMVKVDGCSHVRCWCGYTMDWDTEVTIRDRKLKGFIPVDIFDMKTYQAWERWLQLLSSTLRASLLPFWINRRKQWIDQMMTTAPVSRERIRRLVERRVLRKRFERVRPKLEKERLERQIKWCIPRLVRSTLFMEAVQRAKWRAAWRKVIKAIPTKMFWTCYQREHEDEWRALEEEEKMMLMPGL